jgi:hypothetical protein
LNKQTKEEEEKRKISEEDLKNITLTEVSPIVNKRKNKEELNNEATKKIKTNKDKNELFEDPKFKPIIELLEKMKMSPMDLVIEGNFENVLSVIAFDKEMAKEIKDRKIFRGRCIGIQTS